jgi:hypothetical protein
MPEWIAQLIAGTVITALTPVVLRYGKAIAAAISSRIPKAMIPTVAPLIGFLLELLMSVSGGPDLPGWAGPLAGALAVFLREFLDQWAKYLREHDLAVSKVVIGLVLPALLFLGCGGEGGEGDALDALDIPRGPTVDCSSGDVNVTGGAGPTNVSSGGNCEGGAGLPADDEEAEESEPVPEGTVAPFLGG